MKGFFILFAVGICMSLVGCASSGVMVNPDRVKQFKEGQTTQAEAVAVLGKPVSVFTRGPRTYMSWSGLHTQINPATFIPVVGLFAGGADVTSSGVMLVFNDGVLESSSFRSTEVGSRNGIYQQPVQDQPRKVE